MFRRLECVVQVLLGNVHREAVEVLIVVEAQVYEGPVRTLEHLVVRELVRNHHLDAEVSLNNLVLVVQPCLSAMGTAVDLSTRPLTSCGSTGRDR